MKKKYLLLLLLVAISFITKAQQSPDDNPGNIGGHAFAKGDNILNVGLGLGHFYGNGTSVVGYPSLNLSYEKIFYDFSNGKGALGIGAVGGWWNGRYTNTYWQNFGSNYKISYNRYALGVRGIVHYDLFNLPKLDTYVGLNLGIYIASTHTRYPDPNYPSLEYNNRSTSIYTMYSFFIGARYYLGQSNRFGVFGELGYGLSIFRLGIALNFGNLKSGFTNRRGGSE